MLRPLAAALTLMGATLACGGARTPTPAPSPATAAAAPASAPAGDDLAQLAASVAQMWESLAQRLTAAGSDCAAATAAVHRLRAEFATVLAAQAAAAAKRGAQLDDALDAVAAPLSAAVARVLAAPALQACAADPAFTSVFDDWTTPPPAPR
jgi:hypothetical protein